MLESHGASRILASFHDIIPHWVFAGLYFANDYIEEHPDIVRKVVKGMIDSFEFIKNHEKEAREHLPKYTKVDYNSCMISALREFEAVEPVEHLKEQGQLMVDYGYLKTKIELDEVLDYSFMPDEYRPKQ